MRDRRRYRTINIAIAITARGTATPIPIFAEEGRPPELEGPAPSFVVFSLIDSTGARELDEVVPPPAEVLVTVSTDWIGVELLDELISLTALVVGVKEGIGVNEGIVVDASLFNVLALEGIDVAVAGGGMMFRVLLAPQSARDRPLGQQPASVQ